MLALYFTCKESLKIGLDRYRLYLIIAQHTKREPFCCYEVELKSFLAPSLSG